MISATSGVFVVVEHLRHLNLIPPHLPASWNYGACLDPAWLSQPLLLWPEQLNPDTGELKCSKLVTGKLQGTARLCLQHLETEKQETEF